MYQATTKSILVTVEPQYLPERSSEETSSFFWAYTIEISNQGEEPVQIVSRRWVIVDAIGREEIVEGMGVVGEQPLLAPGQSFEYTSGVPLSTSTGIMSGTYQVEAQDGHSFDIEIPTFSLDNPHLKPTLN